jgi:dodecin
MIMTIVKVIEVISEGDTVDAALKAAIEEAGKTLDNITQVNVKNIEGIVEKNKLKKIRINAKISFIVKH